MKVQVFHLFFKDSENGLVPVDPILFTMARDYAEKNLAEPVDFTDYKETWIACEVDDLGTPTRALGVLCMVLRADFPVFRFTDSAAVVKMVQRANDFLHDVYNARGAEALIYIRADESPAQRCENREEWMQAYGLKPADRWVYTVR